MHEIDVTNMMEEENNGVDQFNAWMKLVNNVIIDMMHFCLAVLPLSCLFII